MKKLILLLICAIAIGAAHANVRFSFPPHSSLSPGIKAKVEGEISKLLTEMTSAAEVGRPISLNSVTMDAIARKRLSEQWQKVHYKCVRPAYTLRCIECATGYTVRGIDVSISAANDSVAYTQSPRRQLTVSFNRAGTITSVSISASRNEIHQILSGTGNVVDDLAMREEILKFVEDFRCYYNEKDSTAISNLFSEKALIITGVTVTETQGDGTKFITTRYKEMNKKQYMDNLRRVFGRNKYINVQFDKISIKQSGSKDSLYYVTLHQKWNSTGYSDDGWLFLLWDFSEREKPKILVRSWQDMHAVQKDGLINESDVWLP